jgi:hypothetical protein
MMHVVQGGADWAHEPPWHCSDPHTQTAAGPLQAAGQASDQIGPGETALIVPRGFTSTSSYHELVHPWCYL